MIPFNLKYNKNYIYYEPREIDIFQATIQLIKIDEKFYYSQFKPVVIRKSIGKYYNFKIVKCNQLTIFNDITLKELDILLYVYEKEDFKTQFVNTVNDLYE